MGVVEEATSYLALFSQIQKRALIRRVGLYLCRGWAQNIVDRWRDAVSPVPRPLPQSILIFFLVIFPLISFAAVLTAALMYQVLKYLVLFPLLAYAIITAPFGGR